MPEEPLCIALATCRDHPGLCAGDDEALIPGLAAEGISATPAVWNDPAVDWGAFDAVLIRTTWDYTADLPGFLAWTRRVESRTRLFNSAATARANLDKRYLKALGGDAVPTVWAGRGSGPDAHGAALDEAARRGWERVVVKPVVGAGAEDLLIAGVSERGSLLGHLAGLAGRCGAMIQPLIEGVRTRGELSVVLIGGAFSHAVRKRPSGEDYRVQIEFGGTYAVETPTAGARAVAERAVTVAADAPLYARVDLVEPEPGTYRVIEVELVEPELFFPLVPEAGRRLGRALRRLVASTMSR